MTSYRILLLADHAQRDIPALAAIKGYIRAFMPSAHTEIISFDMWQRALDLFTPHLVVVNHLKGRRNQMIADTVHRRKGLVAVLVSEGRQNTIPRLNWLGDFPERLCDLWMSWTLGASSYVNPKVNRTEVGCPRFDFYHPPFNTLRQSRDHVCGLYGFDPKKPVITVASSFPNAKFAYRAQAFHEGDWKDLGMTEVPGQEDPVAFAKREKKNWDLFLSWVRALAAEKDYQMLVKPHPAEDTLPWRKLSEETRGKVRVMLVGYAHDFLSVSDCHIARYSCMTLPEAWMSGKPGIGLVMEETMPGPAKDILPLINPITTYARLVDELERQLKRGEPPYGASNYVHSWLGQSPGSSARAAQALVQLLNLEEPKTFKDPTPGDYQELFKLVWQHSNQHKDPMPDHIGQYAKSVRRADVEVWERNVMEVIGNQNG